MCIRDSHNDYMARFIVNPAFRVNPYDFYKRVKESKIKSSCIVQRDDLLFVIKKIKESSKVRKDGSSETGYMRFLAYFQEEYLRFAATGKGVRIIEDVKCANKVNKETSNGVQIICVNLKYVQDAISIISGPEVLLEWIGCEEPIKEQPSLLIQSSVEGEPVSLMMMSKISGGSLNNVRPDRDKESFPEKAQLQTISKQSSNVSIDI